MWLDGEKNNGHENKSFLEIDYANLLTVGGGALGVLLLLEKNLDPAKKLAIAIAGGLCIWGSKKIDDIKQSRELFNRAWVVLHVK